MYLCAIILFVMEISDFLTLIAGKTQPIVVFINGTDASVLRLVKELMFDRKAEMILLGDEADVSQACYENRINDSFLYGVINPKNHPEKEFYLAEYQKLNPEQGRAACVKAVGNSAIFADLMVRLGRADFVV